MRVYAASSGLAIATSLATPAWADCAPNPPRAAATTSCTGSTTGGLVVDVDRATISIPATSTLTAPGGIAALRVTNSSTNSATYSDRLNLQGTIQGDAAPGLLIESGTGSASTQLDVTVGSTGSIRGSTAIVLTANPGATRSTAFASLNNSGRIESTAGPAIVAEDTSRTGFTTILNQAGGFIGGIRASVGTLGNLGTIDGGASSAFTYNPAAGVFGPYPRQVSNSGSILSNSATATLALQGGITISNIGLIANAGSGFAIDAGEVMIDNRSGGVITAAGGTAINARSTLRLTNGGTINGAIIGSGASDTVDLSGGQVNGNIFLGDGDDLLVVDSNTGPALVTNVNGTIDGGTGNDTLEVRLLTDRSFNATPVVPGFETVQLDLVNGIRADVTGTVSGGPYIFGGSGTIATTGSLTGTGTLIRTAPIAGTIDFINSGQIVATGLASDRFVIELNSYSSFRNTGSIEATGGGGLAMAADALIGFQNDGLIRATGTAVRVGISSTASNRGSIISLGGTALVVSGSGFTTFSNMGNIAGAAWGTALSNTRLANTGTISASAGVGVDPGYGSFIDNLAGGVISGTTASTAFRPSLGSSARIRNAGALIGNVDLLAAAFSDDIYMDAGGSLTGNLLLGGGNDTLITDLVQASGRPFAGVTGSIDAGDGSDTLRLRVGADATVSSLDRHGFELLTFELSNNAALTYNAAPLSGTLTLLGQGKVDLTAALSSTDTPAIALGGMSEQQVGGVSGPLTDISVISRGRIDFTLANGFFLSPPPAAVTGYLQNNQGSQTGTLAFENAGTIAVQSPSGGYSLAAAIAGVATVVNSGTISLTRGIGILDATTVTNSGTIVQTASSSPNSTGIRNFTSLINTGSIEVGDAAVIGGMGNRVSITNSGRIVSSGGTAVSSFGTSNIVLNQAGGLIAANGAGPAVDLLGLAYLSNAGTISGNVNLAVTGGSFGTAGTYLADGGTISGALTFGNGNDLLLARDGVIGVSGAVDGGSGFDRFGTLLSTSGTVAVGGALPTNFEGYAVAANDAVVATITGPANGLDGGLSLYGNGSFVNTTGLSGHAIGLDGYGLLIGLDPLTGVYSYGAALDNHAAIAFGVFGRARSFTNSGVIGTPNTQSTPIVSLFTPTGGAFDFTNSGTINGSASPDWAPQSAVSIVALESDLAPSASITNSGKIVGGLAALTHASAVSFANSGKITDAFNRPAVLLSNVTDAAQSLTFSNSGDLISQTRFGIGAMLIASNRTNAAPDGSSVIPVSVSNSGMIAANMSDVSQSSGSQVNYLIANAGLIVSTDPIDQVSIRNLAGGTISATGANSVAVAVKGGATSIINDGTISGGAGTALAPGATVTFNGSSNTSISMQMDDGFLAGAVQTGAGADTLRNNGNIVGSIDLGAGDDRIENYGQIAGNVFLRGGNDTFVQWVGGGINGTVDGGDGIDTFTIDATGGGSVNGSQFVNFERFTQTGSGGITYAGTFATDTIGLDGTTAIVAAGTSFSTSGPVSFTGGDGNEQVRNMGHIAGAIVLGGGNDSVENRGTIGGAVDLGAGDDSFTEGAGSSVGGTVDGGSGRDTYLVDLAGDRSGINARTGFEQLGVIGTGTLALTLDQNWARIDVVGAGLDLKLAGFTPGPIVGGDGAERVSIDGDVSSVALNGGNDSLALGGNLFAGSYSGGSGTDTLRFADAGPVRLTGTVTGFETISLTGPLEVAGTLGAAGDTTDFGAGGHVLTALAGGTLAGSINLGDGDDVLRINAGAVDNATVSGGAGTDLAVFDLTADLAINGDRLQQFETLQTIGQTGALRFAAGTARFDLVDYSGHTLSIDNGAALQAGSVRFGDGDDRMTIAGAFSGSISLGGGDDVLRLAGTQAFSGSADGGSGNNRLEIAAVGSDATPLALGNGSFTNFGSLELQSGVVSYGGTSSFGTINVLAGRLIGLNGSRLSGGRINVAAGATFGSAGTVVGDVTVAGTLSPGASPGTMTITGNVNLVSGSTALFELGSAVSDQLRVSGTLNIASGSTLSLTGTRPLTPGTTLDLIIADGGINGQFTTINQPSSIQGFLRQSADRLQLLSTFATSSVFSPQVNRTIGYFNDVLIAGQASAALLANVPKLLTVGGGSDAAAFQRLSPEAYATASQFGAEQGLMIVQAARTQIQTSPGQSGLFTFGQVLTNRRTLAADPAQGTSRAVSQIYGGVSGLGVAFGAGWIGAFVGYLDGNQDIASLGARTDGDAVIFGLQGQVHSGNFAIDATAAYSNGHGRTRRAALGTDVRGRYSLDNWIADMRVSYAMPVDKHWSIKPAVGVSGIRTIRGALTEDGGVSPVALAVQRDATTRWFLDGDLTLAGGSGEGDRLHPYVVAGVRRQTSGRGSTAAASFVGVTAVMELPGASRDGTLATAGAGLSYDATDRLNLFATYNGEYGSTARHGASVGVRLKL
jgi:hypothetical protein